jgi:hypothetical protein
MLNHTSLDALAPRIRLNDEIPDNVWRHLERNVIGSLNIGCSYVLLVTIESIADTRVHELESNTGVHHAHISPTTHTFWFSEALFIHISACIHDEISIYDMECSFVAVVIFF